MGSSIKLNQLLHDLRVRQTRLSALAGQRSALTTDHLLSEINDLAKALLVADAELLAQQKELDATRAELEIVSARLATPVADAPDTNALLDACYSVSAALNRNASVQQIAQAIARIAADVGLTDSAAVAFLVNAKECATEATTSAAREAAASQFTSREGPAYSTMSGAEPQEFDALHPGRWAAHGQYLQGLGLRHEFALALHCRNVRATLSVYQVGEHPFAVETRQRLALLARHAATVLAQADIETNLRVAVDSRQQVGQAVGILVERHRITPQAAFDRLAHASNLTQTKLRDIASKLIETGEEPQAR